MMMETAQYQWMLLASLSLSISLHLITLPIFIVNKDFREWIAYRLMLVIDIQNLFQLVPNFILVLFYILFLDYPQFLGDLLAGASLVSWDVMMYTHLLLALNRFIAVYRAIRHPTATTTTSRREYLFFNLAIVAICLYFCGCLWLLQTPSIGARFYTTTTFLGVDYRDDLPYSETYETVELCVTSACGLITFAVYCATIVLLKRRRQQILFSSSMYQNFVPMSSHKNGENALPVSTLQAPVETSSQSTSGQFLKNPSSLGQRLITPTPTPTLTTPTPTPTLTGQELRIMAQSFVLFFLMLVINFLWFLADARDPQSGQQLGQVLYFLYGGLHPALILVLNYDFRGRFVQFYARIWRQIICRKQANKSQATPQEFALKKQQAWTTEANFPAKLLQQQSNSGNA